MRLLILLSFIMLMAGCASTAGYEQSLMPYAGKSSDYLVEQLGSPSQTFQMSDGRKVFTYLKDEGSTSGFWGGAGSTTKTACKTDFILKDDHVQSWRFDGNACKQQYDYKKDRKKS